MKRSTFYNLFPVVFTWNFRIYCMYLKNFAKRRDIMKNGFTLVEVLIVMAILIVALGVGITLFKPKVVGAKAELQRLYELLNEAREDAINKATNATVYFSRVLSDTPSSYYDHLKITCRETKEATMNRIYWSASSNTITFTTDGRIETGNALDVFRKEDGKQIAHITLWIATGKVEMNTF